MGPSIDGWIGSYITDTQRKKETLSKLLTYCQPKHTYIKTATVALNRAWVPSIEHSNTSRMDTKGAHSNQKNKT